MGSNPIDHLMNESTSCRGLVGALFGHDFQPRYNTQYTKCQEQGFDDFGEYEYEDMKPANTTYVHDICTRCGQKVIKQ